ncbi:MAG: PEP-CTERM sorting domain-containing protein [Thiobacillus sp.]|uniref:PEP-CTERM sorting domain-containing protein n=1 Tax=Thiobacillus sp. TaxID=924 RepID=UPI002733C56B|nr:PEP-CTERM sorting domain-containing protein [Thiobacillus sp.]MDP3584414.1 PEP-CTERM sorting domain-containing protein [Thiobacillus sp.]
MKKRIAMMLALLASVTSAQASLLDISSFYCQGGELSISTGTTFVAHCSGHLYIDRANVIWSDELISISSGGNLTLWGTLVAPRIQLSANADLSVGGGLFSGSPDFLPEVTALSHAGSENAHLRTFGDIVLNPIIDPVYGAVTTTQMSLPDPIFFESIVIENMFLLTDESAVPIPVPEPRMAMLLGVGALMLFMSRHRKRSVERRGCRESVPDLRDGE